MLLYVGIDISKDTFHASGIFTPKEKAFYGLSFKNSPDGYQSLTSVNEHISISDTVICMESTGVYGEKLCRYLYDAGYAVHVEPPQYVRRAFRLKRKTDRVDSIMIAEYAYRYSDQLHSWKPQDALIEQLKTLLNNREIYQKERTAHKNMLKAIAQKETALEHSHQTTIDFIKTQMAELDEKLNHLIQWKADKETQAGFDMLRSIPGVGWLWAINFYIYSDGFHNLNYRQIASYLGLVPYEYDSGTSVHKNPKTDRSGPDQFRKLLYLSALSVIRRDGKFKRYYQQKKAEGKNGKVILNNIQNKLLKIACACVRDKKPYHEGHRSVNPLKEG